MEILFMVLGGIFLVIVFLLAVLFFTLRAKWKRFKSSLKDLAMAMAGGVPSFRITVIPDEEPEWSKTDVLEAFTKAATDRGFELVGDFEVEEMFSVKLRGFVNPTDNLALAYYEHGESNILADVVAKFTDGRWQTVSNGPEQGLDRPDFAPITRLKVDLVEDAAAGLDELLAVIAKDAGSVEREVLQIDGFAEFFMDAYAKEMDWRIKRGGVSADEVRAVAIAGGQDEPTDEEIAKVQRQWTRAIENFFEEQFRKDVLDQNMFSAAEWEQCADELFFVYDELDRDRFCGEVAWRLVDEGGEEDNEDLHEEKSKWIKAQLEVVDSLRAGARSFFASLPPSKQYVHKGTVGYKDREADVYLQPSQ